MKNFRELIVWRKAHELALAAYASTESFPRHELYGLANQIRRSGASVASNIAEGCGRRGNNEFHRFLQIAAGSASELEYQFLLARDLRLISHAVYETNEAKVCEVKRMLASLMRKVDRERSTPDADC